MSYAKGGVMHWVPIEGFPKYSVNKLGQIRKEDPNGRLLSYRINETGTVYVGLMRDKQYVRSVARIVAQTFLSKPEMETFDTPIHLDGDRLNCSAHNLMWRPRWFAIKYHQQFRDRHGRLWKAPIRESNTHKGFRDPLEAAVRYGLLEADIRRSVIERVPVWPTFQYFEFVDGY
jgi:hypothetical protein